MAITRPTATLFFDKRSKLKKTGKHPVKLTVYYKGTKKRYKLSHSFTDDEWAKLNSPKLRDENLKEEKVKLDFYVGKKFEQALKRIDDPFDFDKFELVYFEDNRPNVKSQDVYKLYGHVIQQNRDTGNVGNAQIYESAMKTFQAMRTRLAFKDVTPDFLHDYESQMLKDGKSVAYIAMNLRTLRTIYNKAISEGQAKNENYPFSKSSNDNKYKIKKGNNTKKALTLEELRLLKNYTPKTPAQRKAYLYWWFSFYANGLNMKDICLLRYKNIAGNRIVVKRAKTTNSNSSSQQVEMTLSPEIKAIIDELGNQDKSPDAYVFNILKHGITAQQERDAVQSFTRNINKHLKKISEEIGFDDVITTYWARHSFSTYLKRQGVSIEVISEALGHASIATTQIYLDSFTDETLEKTAKLLADI